MEETVKFRPHHFMCTLGFQGHGYSLGFVKNYKKIVKRITTDEDALIEVVANIDSICLACPNKLSESLCVAQAKITELDARHQATLGLKAGERLSWRAAKLLIKQKMNIAKFNIACEGCLWKGYGICQNALEKLLRE